MTTAVPEAGHMIFTEVTTVGAALLALPINVVPGAKPVATGSVVAVSRPFQTKLALVMLVCGVVA